jgi:hypothetical protein
LNFIHFTVELIIVSSEKRTNLPRKESQTSLFSRVGHNNNKQLSTSQSKSQNQFVGREKEINVILKLVEHVNEGIWSNLCFSGQNLVFSHILFFILYFS